MDRPIKILHFLTSARIQKYFSFFNNKPTASWWSHIRRDFLICYSCSYYSSISKVDKTLWFVFGPQGKRCWLDISILVFTSKFYMYYVHETLLKIFSAENIFQLKILFVLAFIRLLWKHTQNVCKVMKYIYIYIIYIYIYIYIW